MSRGLESIVGRVRRDKGVNAGVVCLLARTREGITISVYSFSAPKKNTPCGVLFLAQKTRFELVLPFTGTTPLAGEPLEPLGYFCVPGQALFF